MAPRVAIVGVFHETNVFAPQPTQWAAFTRQYRGAELLSAFEGTSTVVGGFLDGARERGWEVVPVFGAYATPSGTLTRSAFDALQAALSQELGEADHVDAVLLELHGAMVAEGVPDAEEAILDTIRHRWPDSPIACVLDLHANMGHRRLSAADVLIGYRTNPHIDTYDRGTAAVRLLETSTMGNSRPHRAHRSIPLVAPPICQGTDASPMREIIQLARDLETDLGLLDVTVHAGFAYSDVPHLGMGFSATAATENAAATERAVEQLADSAWSQRLKFNRALPNPAEAVAIATHRPGRIAVADTGDNINGGSTGDATWLLHEALNYPRVRVLASICDPTSLTTLQSAGVGATLPIQLGGRHSSSGSPISADVTVLHLGDGTFTNAGPMAAGAIVSMGSAAVVRCSNIDVVVQERPVQPNDPQLFRSLGITPEEYDVILLKGAAAIRAGWADVVDEIVDAATPGVTDSDLSRLVYCHAPQDLHRAVTRGLGAPTERNQIMSPDTPGTAAGPDELLVAVAPERPPEAAHNAVDALVRDGSKGYVSGQVAFRGHQAPLTGKVGRDVSVTDAASEAALAIANALHRLRTALGTLQAVDRVLKMTVFVNAVDDFTDHPTVADGASKLLTDVLGHRGRHARAAVGVASLPLGVPVEVELLVRLK